MKALNNDMKKLLLHIGQPKTGTTTIQAWMDRHAAAMATRGIWFCEHRFSHRIAVEFLEDETRKNPADVKRILETGFSEVLSYLRAVPLAEFSLAVFSSEYFSEAAPQAVADFFRSLLPGWAMEVVVYFRRQDRMTESAYNQAVKETGETMPFPSPEYAYIRRYDWYACVKAWESAFGAGCVTPLIFEAVVKENRLIESFMGDFSDRSLPGDTAVRTNESLPAELLEFKRLANRFGEFGLSSLLGRMVKSGFEGTPFRLDREKAEAIVNLFLDSNRKLIAEYFEEDYETLFGDVSCVEERNGIDLTGRIPVETTALILAFFIKKTQEEMAALSARIETLEETLKNALPGKRGDTGEEPRNVT